MSSWATVGGYYAIRFISSLTTRRITFSNGSCFWLMYSRNVLALIQLMLTVEGKLNLNFEDDILRDSCITRGVAAEISTAGKA